MRDFLQWLNDVTFSGVDCCWDNSSMYIRIHTYFIYIYILYTHEQLNELINIHRYNINIMKLTILFPMLNLEFVLITLMN